MRIDAHTHGMHAERDHTGKLAPPVVPIWKPGDSDEGIRKSRALGVEKIVLLDPPEVAFELARTLPDFCVPVPQVPMDHATPRQINDLLDQGAKGVKFIAPLHSYGDNRYLPLYEVLRDRRAPAVFHTGFLAHEMFDPGGFLGREDFIDITHMRPAALDRISRAFPDLKIQMAHFGNPWWEEAWTVLKSNENIYAEFSGGTAIHKSMNMWKELFAPGGKLHSGSVARLVFASDSTPLLPCDPTPLANHIAFYERFCDELGVSSEIRELIDHGNAEELFGL